MPRYAEVIVDVSARRVDKPFHYYVDEEIDQRVCLGSRVLVPFGRRQVEGYVVGFVDEPDVDEVKPILTSSIRSLCSQRAVCSLPNG